MAGGTHSDVRSMVGVPIAADFYSSKGTPIVINLSTGIAYFLNSSGVVTALSGGSSTTTGSTTVDFSTGKTDISVSVADATIGSAQLVQARVFPKA